MALELLGDCMTEKEDMRDEFERVALPHLDILYNTAYRMTGNAQDAQDLVQDTFLRAYRFFDTFTRGTNCKAWLFRILKNNFINRRRKKSREVSTVSFDEIEGGLGVEPACQAFATADHDLNPDLDELVEDDVKLALESLPFEFKMSVLLSDISGFSYKEIAGIMGIPIGTVRSRLSRARGALHRKLHNLASGRRIESWGKAGVQA